MPPKKKKSKDKSASSKSNASAKKSARSSDEGLTFNEAVMSYQVEVKQAQIKEVQNRIEELKAKNAKQKLRTRFLKQEQNKHIKEVILQAREKEKQEELEVQVTYGEVEQALKEKLETLKTEQKHIDALHSRIQQLDADIVQVNGDLSNLQTYRETGRFTDETHITVLNKEMADMEASLTEMTEFFDKSLQAVKQEIIKKNQINISNQKELASNEVFNNLDKHQEQEFLDNKWLKKEVGIHRNNIEEASALVERLGNSNLSLMDDLFDKQLADVNETQKFYLQCKEEEERELENYCQKEGDEDDEDDNLDDEDIEGQEELPDDIKWLDNYLPDFRSHTDSPCSDYQVSPMQMRLLTVTGSKMPIRLVEEDGNVNASSIIYQPWNVERAHLKGVKSVS